MKKLLRTLKMFYAKNKRDFLWRHTKDPYHILVSEIMLQQTQVKRVLLFYAEFTRRFPTLQSLAKAPLSDVLKAWQGLGYNRRAKFLHEAAKKIAQEYKVFPRDIRYIERLPGVGHYTARAIAAFAFNKPEVFIETNIRTVFIHSGILENTRIDSKISDQELLPLVAETLKKSKMQPRDFYAALMDYGAFLKASGIKLNSRSKHYTKQSKFEGSARQKRAAKLRKLLHSGASEAELLKILNK